MLCHWIFLVGILYILIHFLKVLNPQNNLFHVTVLPNSAVGANKRLATPDSQLLRGGTMAAAVLSACYMLHCIYWWQGCSCQRRQIHPLFLGRLKSSLSKLKQRLTGLQQFAASSLFSTWSSAHSVDFFATGKVGTISPVLVKYNKYIMVLASERNSCQYIFPTIKLNSAELPFLHKLCISCISIFLLIISSVTWSCCLLYHRNRTSAEIVLFRTSKSPVAVLKHLKMSFFRFPLML